MSSAATKKEKTLLHMLVYFVLMSLGWLVPPIEPITAEGMHLLGVFLAAVYGWSVTSDVWPSFLTMAAFMFTGLVDLKGAIAIGWGSDIVLFVVLLFVFVAFMEATGTTTYLAAFLMTRKFVVGHPWRLIFMIFLCAYLLATFCGVFPGMLITWGFIYTICDVLGYKPFDKFSNLLIFGVGVMGAMSLSAVPWAHNALVILNSYMATSGENINYLHYLAYSVPVALFSIFGFMLICKFIFHLDVSKLKDLDPNIFGSDDLKLTTERKITLGALLVLILILVIPSLLPADNTVRVVSDLLGMSLKTVLLFAALSLIRVKGQQIFNFGQLATKSVPWNMIMMTCGIMSFVGLLGDPRTGISAFLGKLLTPVFSNSGVLFFFILTVIITILLTNFMINMVVAVIMITATMPIAASLGVDSLQVVYLITVCCTIAFMLPVSSAASCCLFANTKWVRAKDVYKYSVPTILMMAIVALGWNFILFMF